MWFLRFFSAYLSSYVIRKTLLSFSSSFLLIIVGSWYSLSSNTFLRCQRGVHCHFQEFHRKTSSLFLRIVPVWEPGNCSFDGRADPYLWNIWCFGQCQQVPWNCSGFRCFSCRRRTSTMPSARSPRGTQQLQPMHWWLFFCCFSVSLTHILLGNSIPHACWKLSWFYLLPSGAVSFLEVELFAPSFISHLVWLPTSTRRCDRRCRLRHSICSPGISDVFSKLLCQNSG